jgi:hypothetical protein
VKMTLESRDEGRCVVFAYQPCNIIMVLHRVWVWSRIYKDIYILGVWSKYGIYTCKAIWPIHFKII